MDPTRRHARRSIAPLAALGLALVALIGLAGSSLAVVPADYSNVVVGLQPFMTGLDGPVLVTNAGDGSRRLFVVEQRGVIKVWRSGHALSTFLDMRSKVESSSEQGLLALAFHPDYEHNRKFYVLFTEKGTGDVIVAEYKASTVDRNKASSSSFRRLLRIGHRDNTNHNGGMLAFGKKNGYLYISRRRRRWRWRHAEQRPEPRFPARQAPPDRCQRDPDRPRLPDPVEQPVGEEQDGEARDLVVRAAQSLAVLVRPADRRHLDRRRRPGGLGRGRQGAIAGSGGRAANYGWHIMEGNACYQPSSGCPMTGLQLPVAVYDHGAGCAIIGGYVYRGPETLLRGAYLFSDVCSGTIWSIVAAGPSTQTPTVMANTGLGITSFGEGESGTVYVTAQDGNVYKLTAATR